MIDKSRIRLMTKLAIHDKMYGRKDEEVEKTYRFDYVYKKNFVTRLGVLMGMCILFGFYALDLIFVREIDLASYNYVLMGKIFAVSAVVILIIYSLMGMVIYGREYRKTEKRMKNYHSILKKLMELDK